MKAIPQDTWPRLLKNVDGTKKHRKVRELVPIKESSAGLNGGPQKIYPPGSWECDPTWIKVFVDASKLRDKIIWDYPAGP